MKRKDRTRKQQRRARTRVQRERRKQQKELLKRKRRIEWRLRERDWTDQPQPMFTGGNINYEVAERARGMEAGGIGVFLDLAQCSGLVDSINEHVHLLKLKLP